MMAMEKINMVSPSIWLNNINMDKYGDQYPSLWLNMAIPHHEKEINIHQYG
jgi:hypothetical protein